MFHKTRGVVLHTIKYSETSVISKIYTEKFGLLSFIIKGVRSAAAKNKASLLQPMTLLDMDLQYRENRNLQFIKEFKRAHTYASTPFNTVKGTIALFLLEVITKAIKEHEPNDEMFEFIYDSFIALDDAEPLNPDFHLLFLVHFSRYLGFFPHQNYSEHNCCFEMREGLFIPTALRPAVMGPGESQALNALLHTRLYEAPAIKINRALRKSLLNELVAYYQLHLENFSLKSPQVLQEILG